MKKLLSILLAAAMLLGLLAGCGASAESAAAASASAPEVQSETADAPEEEPAETESEAAEPEADSAEEAADAEETEPEVSGREITLPISEDVLTYTYWLCYAPFAADLIDTDTMEGILVLDTLQEITNIHFDMTAANGAAEQDNFNLMIAGGDYADIMFAMGYYGTGLEGAVEDGIIQDLADVLPEKCPTYWSYLSKDTSTLMAAYTDSGYMPTICALTPEVAQEVVGPVIRQDWLREFGMEVPRTYDELYDYLKKSYDEKGAIYEVPTTDGLFFDLAYGQNIDLDGYEVVDGQVEFGLAQDRAKDYFKFMNRIYADGLMSQDFFSSTNADLGSQSRLDFGLGLNSLVSTAANNTSDIMMNVSDDAFEMAVLPYVSADGGEAHVGESTLLGMMKDNDNWAFSADCEDIDPLLDLVEYLFSDDAYLLTNYGVEDVTYTLDSEGKPHYTDLIINNPDGLSYFFASYVYATNAASSFFPFLNDMSRTFFDFTDNQWQVYVDLRTLSDCAWNYPDYAVMTTDETAEYASIESDLSTYLDSKILEFITGSADVDEEWDSFVDILYSMGLQDMIDLKQDAYDRAMERVNDLTA
ncbi:MAG: extracellular solute-binding protein [Oscillospiraceae bacterium]|nr:extracellular solute-binding protein [Oscillospiraceae bacterium]